MLRKIEIHHSRELTAKAKALYYAAFPREERIPWSILWWNTKRKDLYFTAYLDGTVFCGFTIAVQLDGLYYVLFFAVDETLRGKGYGSQILGQLRDEYGTLGLNIEPLDPTAENYAQRQKRFAFYQKNGFLDTEHYVWEVGGKFRVLSTDKKLPMSQVKKVFRKLTMGLLNVKTQ